MAAALISRLEEKIQLLLKKMQSLQEENQRLQNMVTRQEDRLQEEQNNIKELEHQVALLKIASTAGSNGQDSPVVRKELRTTLNKYIREIDHCIAKLNE